MSVSPGFLDLPHHLVKGVEVRSQCLLALLQPALHVGPALVDVAVNNPVLCNLAEKRQVSDRDLVTSHKLLVLEEVGFDDVQGLDERLTCLSALGLISGNIVEFWNHRLGYGENIKSTSTSRVLTSCK